MNLRESIRHSLAVQENLFAEDNELVPTGGASRRDLFKTLAQKVATAPLAQAAVTQAITHAMTPPKKVAPWHDLPQELKSLPSVAHGYGYEHAGSAEGVHTFKHPNGNVLMIKKPGVEKPGPYGKPMDRSWELKTKDEHLTYHTSHGTPLSSLDTELDAQHNPKPEWFANKHLTPATSHDTDFEANCEDPHDCEDGDSHNYHMVHLDRESMAPGSHYAGGYSSHPHFRASMRRAGLAHLLPHAEAVGYSDISLPIKDEDDAHEVSRHLQHVATVSPGYKGDFGDNPASVRPYHGYADIG